MNTPSSMDMPSEPMEVSFRLLKPFSLAGEVSGEENIPSTSSIPCSSRLPSFNINPVRLYQSTASAFSVMGGLGLKERRG